MPRSSSCSGGGATPRWLREALDDVHPSDIVTVYFDNDEEAPGVSINDVDLCGWYLDGEITSGAYAGQTASFDVNQIAYLSINS